MDTTYAQFYCKRSEQPSQIFPLSDANGKKALEEKAKKSFGGSGGFPDSFCGKRFFGEGKVRTTRGEKKSGEWSDANLGDVPRRDLLLRAELNKLIMRNLRPVFS